MSRTIPHKARQNRRRKLAKITKGFIGTRSKLFRIMKQSAMRAMAYAYRDRRNRKRDMRSLWIIRISAACKELGGSYSTFIGNLKKKEIVLDRKILAHLAAVDADAFRTVFEKAAS
jgi:large subunit ribosomal protein L20